MRDLCNTVTVISCLCFLIGLSVEECSPAVLARRETFVIEEGESLSLSCVVQHCGQAWTGMWVWKNTTNEMFTAVTASNRHRLSNVSVSANETKLDLDLLSVLQMDEGSYRCTATWEDGDSEQGHLNFVKVKAAVSSQRTPQHRLLVCFAAFLCLPAILGLACLSSKTKPQPCAGTWSCLHMTGPRRGSETPPPPPRQDPANHFTPAPDMSENKQEVLYTAVRLEKPRQTRDPRQSTETTIYASVRVS